VGFEIFTHNVPITNRRFKGFHAVILALFRKNGTQEALLEARVVGVDVTNENKTRLDAFTSHSGYSWIISGSDAIGGMKMKLFDQPINLDSTQNGADVTQPSCNLGRQSRKLLALQSSTSIGIFALPPAEMLLQGSVFGPRLQLDFSSSLQGAFVIKLAEQHSSVFVADFEVFSDCWPRLTAQSNGLWLVAALSSPGNNSVVVKKLSEFEYHTSTCTEPLSPSRMGSTFPIRFASETGFPCAPQVPSWEHACDLTSHYWNTSSCVRRYKREVSLDFSPIQLERRFIGQPTGLVDTQSLLSFKSRMTNETISAELESFMYNALFIRDSFHRVHVFGMQEDLRRVNALYSSALDALHVLWVELSSFYSAAKIEAMAIPENGEHAFVATSRQRWEIEAQSRLVEICETRTVNETTKALLRPYEPLCDPPTGLKPAKPSIASFVFFMSMCTSGIYCPSFVSAPSATEKPMLLAQQPEGGTYALFPGKLRNCSKGHFCSDGKEKPCPIGYKCPYERMSLPIRCEPDPQFRTTCFNQGLADEMECPNGFVCTGMDVPPTPAPPGFFLPNSTYREGPGTTCAPGEYCALAAGDPAPSCPGGFACSDPSSILPEMCFTEFDEHGTRVGNGTSYCPAGTAIAALCPAGFYCTTPAEKVACDPGQECPAGTQVARECPAGRLCADPKGSVPCPAGFYCPQGASSPIRCSPLSLCAEGSSQERRWLALLIESIAIVVAGISYKLITIWNNRRWKRLMKKRQEIRANAVNRYRTSKDEDDFSNQEQLPLISSERDSAPEKEGSAPSRPGLTVEFKNLELKVGRKDSKIVLQSVSGKFEPGELAAVMGPSGAGKTSLISVLSGQVDKTAGEILVNGVSQPSLARYKSVMGFVPQEDIMHRTLTVREILDFNAATRLDHRMSAGDREDLVDDIIDILGLKKVEHSIIGDETRRGLSGGERKRVNVGMELAADPSILFLDEPTSGLDSTSAVQVTQCLKTVASRSNMTIVCVIHQPRAEVFKLFDSVLFLQPGGRTVYQGTIDDAPTYFAKHLDKSVPEGVNAADYYMDVISEAVGAGDDLSTAWDKSVNTFADELEAASSSSSSSRRQSVSSIYFKPRTRAGFFWQLWLLFIRSLTLQLRDIGSYLLNIFLIFVAGLLLGFIYSGATFVGPASEQQQAACPEFVKEICAMPMKDDYVGQFTLLVLSLGLTGVAGALNTFGSERVTFIREFRSGVSTPAFFIAKNLASIPMLLLPPLFLWSIFYFLTAPSASFWTVYMVLIAVQFCCTAAGYVISLLAAQHTALLAGVVYTVICTLFSGSNPTLKKLNNFGVPAQILYKYAPSFFIFSSRESPPGVCQKT
jgi:ABC-type multidrug transport system ATPase subunit